MLDLDGHEFGASESSGKPQENQRAVAQRDDVIVKTGCKDMECLEQDWRLALLERSFFAADGFHCCTDETALGGIAFPLVACGHMVFRDGRDAPRHRVGFGRIRQIVEIVDNCLRRSRQIPLIMVGTPLGKIAPVGSIGLSVLSAFDLLRRSFAFAESLLLSSTRWFLISMKCLSACMG